MMFRVGQAWVLVLLQRVTDDVKSHLPSSKHPAVSVCLFSAHFSSFLIFIYWAAPGGSCGRWDPVPKIGIEPGPLLGEHKGSTLDPAGKALMSYFQTNGAPLMLRPLSWRVCQLVSEIDTAWLIFKGQERLGKVRAAGHEQVQALDPELIPIPDHHGSKTVTEERDRFRFPR